MKIREIVFGNISLVSFVAFNRIKRPGKLLKEEFRNETDLDIPRHLLNLLNVTLVCVICSFNPNTAANGTYYVLSFLIWFNY